MPPFTPPLRTQGRYILDGSNKRFKLCAVNWFGGSDELFIPSGLDVRHRDEIAATIKSMGFNTVRMPYSDEMVMTNPVIPSELLSKNEDLIGKTALDVFAACITALTEAGLAVIPNDHITQAKWCDGFNLSDAAWHNDHLPFVRVRLTEEQWIVNLETIMKPHMDNPLVIGCDLRNEVRGLWGTMPWRKWAVAAERAGNRLLKLRKDWLIVVEGVSSANDLSGVKERPVKLDIPNRVVYSSHVFTWSGWGELKPFGKREPASLFKALNRDWGYLLHQDIAPVWVGEFGCARMEDTKNEDYEFFVTLTGFFKDHDVDWGYWPLNPRKPHNGEKETWGLLEDDWRTIVEDGRMELLRKIMVSKTYD